MAADTSHSLAHRAGSQGLLLLSGYGAAQAFSFARNAVLGHWLSQGDFGIAATITLFLQLFETISDLGSDRLIVQAEDGDSEKFVSVSHSVLIARGILLCLLLLALGPTIAQFFKVEHAVTAFQIASLVPLIKGFMHLDCRRAQRRLDNRPQMILEVLPQALALLATARILTLAPDYNAVVWLSIIQAASAVVISHWLAERPYRASYDPEILRRQIEFGWPILLSALPLIAVYQGDRMIVGRLIGMEALAAYAAAFMITMVPGLLAAKAGHALMLPIFSDDIRRRRSILRRLCVLTETTVLASSLYLVLFVVAGEAILPLAFGENYAGYGSVTAALAAMWSLRMVQAVPGMALMAAGQTKPFLVAGLLRASVLPVAFWAAYSGADLATIAVVGVAGEAMSLAYVAARLNRSEPLSGRILVSRTMFLVPVSLFAFLVQGATGISLATTIAALVATGTAVLGIGVAIMPALRAQLRSQLALEKPARAG